VNADRMNLVLGFCWLLLRKFHTTGPEDEAKDKSNALETSLLHWCKETLAGYSDIDLKDGFKSTSFHNGKVLLGLLSEYDKSSLDYSKYTSDDRMRNITDALKIGETVIGIPGDLVDPEELANGTISDGNMVLYLSLLYNAYKEKYQGQTKDSILKRISSLEERLRELITENEELKSNKNNIELKLKTISEQLEIATEENSTILHSKEEVETELGSLKETYSKEKTELQGTISELVENINILKSASGESQHHLESAKEEIKKERDSIREELQKTKEKLNKEKEDLQSEQEQLLSSVSRAQKKT